RSPRPPHSFPTRRSSDLLVLLAVRRLRLIKPRELSLTLLAFVVLPAGIYVLSYWPWMAQGHSLSELLPLQKAIWRYHADLRATQDRKSTRLNSSHVSNSY